MSVIKINMDSTQEILLKRYLNKNGAAQIKFTKECAKEMNPYIPYDTGRLKDWMIKINVDNIVYDAPYAKKQYYTNLGNGKQGRSNGGIRGNMWDKRMWNSRGNEIINKIAYFCGGRVR